MCAHCHTLVHAGKLERLAAEARALEEAGSPAQARERWLKTLDLLPQTSTQAAWVRKHASVLEAQAHSPAPSSAPHEKKWVKKLGPLAPIAVLLAKSKSLLALFKLKFLFSLGAFMGLYWSLYGMKFGVGFAVLILLHEMGHYIDIRRRGLPADMPVFLPGLGAYVRWQGLGVSQQTRAAISLAGPLAGWLVSVACAVLWWKTGAGLWAALARSGAWLNLLNLIPVWVLDGGQAATALNKAERVLLLTLCLALWLVLGESVFFLVAAGFLWRLFTKDLPAEPSRSTLAYFMIVLTLLGVMPHLMPGKGFGSL